MADGDGPGRKPRIENDDVLACFAESPDRCEPLTAGEVADSVDCHHNTARNHLEDLVFAGELDSKKAGPGKVYWVPCHPERTTRDREFGRCQGRPDGGPNPGASTGRRPYI